MVENEHVRREFRHILEQRPDLGDTKIISSWFLEPPNIFDPKPRKRLKHGVAIGLIYIALIAVVCTASNFN